MAVEAINLTLMAGAIEAKYRCRAVHLESVRVEDWTHWHSRVEVFGLTGHPEVNVCYAWATGPRNQYVIILHKGLINSADAAVKAWGASNQTVMESVVVEPYWHGRYFISVGTVAG